MPWLILKKVIGWRRQEAVNRRRGTRGTTLPTPVLSPVYLESSSLAWGSFLLYSWSYYCLYSRAKNLDLWALNLLEDSPGWAGAVSGAERVSFNAHGDVRVESLGWEESSWKSKARKMGQLQYVSFSFWLIWNLDEIICRAAMETQTQRTELWTWVAGRKERVKCMERE